MVDFGLVKDVSAPDDVKATADANTVTGTPLYMAPESIRSADTVDARSDIYALGAVAYFLPDSEHVVAAVHQALVTPQ